MNPSLQQVITTLRRGGIVAYPTEAVFGLGCDPFNETAVNNLLRLKHRSLDKGLILIARSWQDIQDLTIPIPYHLLQKALKTWPGPITWIFPAHLDRVPKWIRGEHASIALRVTNHPIAKAICEAFQGPIVSTSANIEGKIPARTITEIHEQFPQGIDYIYKGELGGLEKPTPIYDILTDKSLRS